MAGAIQVVLMSKSTVSVLMCTYNRASLLGEAVESILNQTYDDFEFLILDDGSTDSTKELLTTFQKKDKRIKLFENNENTGSISGNRNTLLKEATGRYIALMDDDEICLKNRLEIQTCFMESHQDVDICGAWAKNIGTKHRINKTPVTDEAIKARLMFGCPYIQPLVFIRKSFIDKYAISYNPDFHNAEDFELWSRCYWKTDVRFYNIPEVLLKCRFHNSSVSVTRLNEQVGFRNRVIAYNLANLGVEDPNVLRFLLTKQTVKPDDLFGLKDGLEKCMSKMDRLFPKYGRKAASRYFFKQIMKLKKLDPCAYSIAKKDLNELKAFTWRQRVKVNFAIF